VINYDGRRFRPVGEDGDRVAVYRQDGDLLWGEFVGGRARRGTLAGVCADDGTLDFAYCMVLENGDVISGHCTSTPHVLDDGRIRLDEVWQRFGHHESAGVSAIEEIPDPDRTTVRTR
jgi:hypothetical protein